MTVTKPRKVNIHDVAKRSSVSPATVSRVLNRRHSGSDQVRARVEQAAIELGYSAQVTVSRNRLPLIIDESEHGVEIGTYEAQMISRICGHCLERGVLVEVIPVRSIPLLAMTRATAAISLTFRSDTTSLVTDLGLPLVSINNPIEGACNVHTDHRAGLVLAVDYLKRMGHRRIGFWCGDLSNWGNKQRIAGFREAMAGGEVHPDDLLVLDDRSNDSILESVLKLARRDVTAFIFSGEAVALRAQHAFDLLEKRIGIDVSIMTFEDPSISAYTSPPQTTIAQPFDEIARVAVDSAMKLASGDRRSVPPELANIVLPNRLIERESVCRL